LAPNFGEARGAESHADFIHKYGIILKALNETFIWSRATALLHRPMNDW
jgi:hypothetical protein